jgi:hypothetical protein
MKRTAMILFSLWGLVHILGGALMLLTLGGGGVDGAEAYLATVATADPSSAALVPPTGSPAIRILGFHAWNLIWVGLMVTGVAITLNRKASRAGLWVNLGLVSGADLGLLLFLVIPGVMSWTTALPGLILWLQLG